MSDTDVWTEPKEHIHTWFSLTYANYLVVEPAAVQALPAEQRARFDQMRAEVGRAFAHVPSAGRYLALAGNECEYDDLSDIDMAALGITTNIDSIHEDSEPETPQGDDESDADFIKRSRAWEDARWEKERDELRWYDARGDEWERDRRLVVPTETPEQADAAARVVIPRAFLQSMPEAWQDEFVTLLNAICAKTRELGVEQDYKVVPQRLVAGREDEWEKAHFDPAPHYNRGRTRLEPQLPPRGTWGGLGPAASGELAETVDREMPSPP